MLRYKLLISQSQTYTLAVLRETLRLFPPVPRLWKIVQQDSTLPYQQLSADGSAAKREYFFAPKDSLIVLDFAAIHMSRASRRVCGATSHFGRQHFIGDMMRKASAPRGS